MRSVNRLLDAAIEIQRYCDEQGWICYFIGGIAVQHFLALKDDTESLPRLEALLQRLTRT